ncbi:MAG: histidine phosphatase family protein [Bacteroidota bacterium]
MLKQTVYIVRHGQTDYNLRGIVQGSGVDSSLNDTGRAQAAAFYDRYREKPFELVITSKLKRTKESVAGFLQDGLPHIADADINEMHWGTHEGKVGTPESIAEYQRIKDAWATGDIDGRIGGGESAREMGQRLQRFLDSLRQRPERLILVCSHGRAMCGLVTLMKGMPINMMNSFRHSNLGLWSAQLEDDVYRFELENDLSHLDKLAQII